MVAGPIFVDNPRKELVCLHLKESLSLPQCMFVLKYISLCIKGSQFCLCFNFSGKFAQAWFDSSLPKMEASGLLGVVLKPQRLYNYMDRHDQTFHTACLNKLYVGQWWGCYAGKCCLTIALHSCCHLSVPAFAIVLFACSHSHFMCQVPSSCPWFFHLLPISG